MNNTLIGTDGWWKTTGKKGEMRALDYTMSSENSPGRKG